MAKRMSMAFGSFYRNNAGLVNMALMMLFLIGIETALDGSFECPNRQYSPVLSAIYSFSFFVCPAIIFIFLGLNKFPGANKKRSCPCWSGYWNGCYVFLHVGKIPLIWLLIAMTDGQFLACFVVAVSRYELDFHLFVYIFQTSGMLALTVFCGVWYWVSKVTFPCLEDSRRTYSLLHDVEGILVKDEVDKEKEEDTQKFLVALKRNSAYEYQRLPRYMLDKENVLEEKLREVHLASAQPGNDNGQ